MRTLPLLTAGLLAFMATVQMRADATTPSHDDSFTKEGLFKANALTLKDTQLVVSPEMPLAQDKNMFWCGTLQLAWNEATALVGEKMQFDRSSPAADLLNAGKFTRHDLDPASYVAIADFERNHVEAEIRAALEKVFHGAASPELIPQVPPNPGPDDFVAYSYLYKSLVFAHPFSDKQILFGDHIVEAFGFDNDAPDGYVPGQAEIYDHQSDDDFIVQLRTKSPQDELILAKITPGPSLDATIHTVLERMAKNPPEEGGSSDNMSVPKLNFDLRRDFPELEGLIYKPTPAAKIKNKLVIAKAEQLIRFQLNEKGAILKSEAVVEMKALAMRARYHLVFDKPFLILLKQSTSKQPYFALWVGNASLLVPEQKK